MDIKAIREALEQNAKCPWERNLFSVYMTPYPDMPYQTLSVCIVFNENVGNFIANTPEWLRQLLDENQKLREELKGCEYWHKKALDDKAAAVEVLNKIRKMTPYGLYHEMIDPVLERLERGESNAQA